MTTNNNFVCFEDVMVSKTRTSSNSFKVNLEMEGYIFYIEKAIVDEITKDYEDENLVAIILAYIKYVRVCRNANNQRKAKRLSEKVLISGVSDLLGKYPSDELIKIIRNLKWHEICRVLESDDPTKEIEEII